MPGSRPGASENAFVRTHLQSNLQSRNAWNRFRPHRERLTGLIQAHTPPGGSLCILGAGNCNDLDLRSLKAGEIHLVDLDSEALGHGVDFQQAASLAGLRLHPSCDVSGLLRELPPKGDACEPGAADALAARLESHHLRLPGGPFDCVVSAGLLTQMFQSLGDSGLGRDAVVELTLRLRRKHLRDLADLTRPGGSSLLVTDVVATSTAPDLLRLPAAELEPQMAALIAQGNFFTGTNPYRIMAVLEEVAELAQSVEQVRLHGPWLWAVTADRRHLACAVSFRRRFGAKTQSRQHLF